MGEIRISIPSENLGFPYPVCKKLFFVMIHARHVLFADSQVVSGIDTYLLTY